ncbi:MAG: PEP/pyruvate-binding domain-containing protein [Caldilineaceae bacterium]
MTTQWIDPTVEDQVVTQDTDAPPVSSAADPMVLPLDHNDVTLAMVGGKGMNLTKLARAGFSVPGGFLVTTAAYTAFVAANRLVTTIETALTDTDLQDPAALERASTQIRQAFVAGEIPVALRTDIAQAYQALDCPPVAVRSSATAEDLPDMSFAGQQDTYLNIVGEAALLDAVKECWGSLWTARAIGYRQRNRIAHSDVALSVVVQAMVQSEVSGVLFTANPLTGNRHETVIDATLGLGEALVSGLVEPDHYIVETTTGQIRKKTLGDKATVIQGQSGGGTVTVTGSQAERQALPDEEIRALTKLGKRVADFYDFPQDIEWAWAKGELYLLQARPITSLYPVPTLCNPKRSLEQPEVYFSFGAVQGMLDPMTPLGQDAIKSIFAGGARLFGFAYTWETQPLITTAGGRLWVRMSELLYNRVGQRLAPKFLEVVEPSIGQATSQLLNEPAFANSGRPQLRTIGRIARFVGLLLPTLVRSAIDPDGQREVADQRAQAMLHARTSQMAATTTLSERVDLFEEIVSSSFPFAVPTLVPRIAPGMIAMNRLISLADQHLDQEAGHRRALEVARGLPHNVTTEMDLLLWHSAQAIRNDAASLAVVQQETPATLAQQALRGELPTVAQQTVDTFLQRYGMRGLAEIDFGRPRWRENPTQVMQMLQSYLRIDDASQAPDAVFARGEEAANAVIADLAAAVRTGPLGWLKSKLVYMLAKRMRALAGLRETPKFIIIQLFGMVRAALLQSGQALVDAGTLDRADDLMFLHIPELRALAAGEQRAWKALIAERRATYDREKRRNQIPRVMVSDGRAFYEGAAERG